MTIAYSTDQTLNYSFRRTSSLEYHVAARWTLATAKTSFPTSSTAQVKWGTTSINFNGTDQTISFSGTQGILPNTSVATGGLLPTGSSGDWTCELWIYIATGDLGIQRSFFDAGANGVAFGITPGNKLYFGTSNVTYGLTSTNSVSGNTWTHICAMRSGGTRYLFIDGGSVVSGASANYTTGTNPFNTYIHPNIGYGVGGTLLKGYIQDFRISNAAMYSTGGFTAPTAPLTNQSTTRILIPGYDGTIQDNPFV